MDMKICAFHVEERNIVKVKNGVFGVPPKMAENM
jgi:hypothetical protein